MKKILLTIGAFSVASLSFAQQQITNSNMETWETVSGSDMEPTNWNSFLTASGSLSGAAANQIQRTTDIRPGSTGMYSARIYSRLVPFFNIVANGNMTLGQINMGSASPTNANNYNYSKTSDPAFSEAFTGTPDSLVFWVKYTPVNSSSQARVRAVLHDAYDFRDPTDAASAPHIVAVAELNYPTTSGQWVRKSIPFLYSGPATVNTHILATFTSNMTPGGGDGTDQIWIDDIELIYNPSPNGAVVANDDAASTAQGVAVSVNVATNDTDPENSLNLASVTVSTAPANGTTSVNTTTGAITYTPNAGFSGTDTFVYTICDNGTPQSCDNATVTVTVNGNVNAVNDAITTPQDQAIVINILGNDTDPENSINAASVTITTAPTNGTTSINTTTGAVTYTPNAGFFGTDSFVYNVCDNGTPQTCDNATVTITVTEVIAGVNNQIIANNDAVTTLQANAIVVNVLSNDVDPENQIDNASLVVITAPANGTTSVNTTTGEITYTPNATFNGTDSFVYKICDSGTPDITCDSATVTITVSPSVSVAELNAENIQVSVSNQMLVIKSTENLTGTVEVYSTAGQLVQQSAIEPLIPFNQQPGIYFVRLHSQFGTTAKKVAHY